MFGNYTAGDLTAAGAPKAAIQKLRDTSDPDWEARLAGIPPIPGGDPLREPLCDAGAA